MTRLLKPCGTVAAYARHVRRGEPIDDACRDAARVYKQIRRTGSAEPRELQPCGTNAAYVRHLNHNEEPCAPCREAHRKYAASSPTHRSRARGRSRALSLLAGLHYGEFLDLLDAEMKREGLK